MSWWKFKPSCPHHYHETGNSEQRPVARRCAEDTPTEEWVEGKCCWCGVLTWRPNPRYNYDGIGG